MKKTPTITKKETCKSAEDAELSGLALLAAVLDPAQEVCPLCQTPLKIFLTRQKRTVKTIKTHFCTHVGGNARLTYTQKLP